MRGAEVPLRSCCASAALGRAPPVCCEPARPGCARSAAGPSPSSPGAASSAAPSAASGHSDVPPTAEIHRKNPPHANKGEDTTLYILSPQFSIIIHSPARHASWWWLPVSVLECGVCSNFASAAWLPSLNSHKEFDYQRLEGETDSSLSDVQI